MSAVTDASTGTVGLGRGGPRSAGEASLGAAPLFDARRGLYYAKPRLRGWLHLVAFEAALVVGTLVIVTTQGAAQTTVACIYAASVAGLFGTSALYHRGRWGAAGAAILQRLDHVMIVLLIAGTATPAMTLTLTGAARVVALGALWMLASAAIVFRLAWMSAPEKLVGTIYVALGWTAGAAVPAVWLRAGVAPALLLIAGGLLYTLGALGYHHRRPDPRPASFGYHEVFHTSVVVAAACQYVAIACFLL